MADTERIENYITVTFAKLTDNQGKPINIGLALPTLINIILGTPSEFAQQKYDFLGEAACQFAISSVIARHYSQYDNRILSALVKKFRSLSRLHKILDQEIHLRDYVLAPFLPQTMDSIFGVLNAFYGINVVEKLIEAAVLHIVGIELGLVQSKKNQMERQKQEQDNPIYTLNQLIYTKGGTIDTTAQQAPSLTWEVKITAKFNASSIMFSHSRIAQSKQKAKTEAAKDILNFMNQRPDVYEQLQQPADGMSEIHALPISEADYYRLAPIATSDNLIQQVKQEKKQQQSNSSTANWTGGDPNNIHIPYTDDEDAIQLMSNLLLNGNNAMDVEMTDESPTKKRQRQSIFNAYPDIVTCNDDNDIASRPMPVPTSSTSPHPEIKTEDPASEILAAIQQPPPAQPVSSVTYIKTEEEFTPFNQPTTTPVYNEKTVAYFKNIFIPHRHLLIQTLSMPGQSKSVFLSLVLQHQDILHVEVKSQQGGSSHSPFFSAVVILKSKSKPQAFLKTEGMSKRKKDAEQMAFAKLIELLK